MTSAARTTQEKTVLRPVRAVLIRLSGERAAVLTLVVADELPRIVMLNGDPFLIEQEPDPTRPFYFQERPFRADIGD